MKRQILLLGAFFAGTIAVLADIDVKSTISDGHVPLVVQPGSPATSYPLSSFESIDVYSGKVNVSVPLLTIGGRGEAAYAIKANVRNSSWTVQVDTSLDNGVYSHSSGAVWDQGGTLYRAWYGPGMVLAKRSGAQPVACNNGASFLMTQTYTHFVFLEPDGTEHALYPQSNLAAQINYCGVNTTVARGPDFASADDSKLVFHSIDTNGSPLVSNDWTDPEFYGASGAVYNPLDANGTLFFPDGRQYSISSGLVTTITDRNGNQTKFQYLSVSDPTHKLNLGSVFVSRITDPTGRVYGFEYGVTDSPACAAPGVECDRISYTGYNNNQAGGSAQKIVIQYKQLNLALREGSFPASPNTLFPNLLSVQDVSTEAMLSRIDLPNGASWQFQYNIYAELAKVTLPTGGSIEYDHGPGLSTISSSLGTYNSGQVLDNLVTGYPLGNGAPNPPWRPFIYRRLTARREYSNASTANPAAVLVKTSTYSLFEAVSNAYPFPQLSAVADVVITGGAASVTHTGSNMNPSYESHSFHDRVDSSGSAGDLSAASPGASIKFAPTAGFLTFPDVFQGKEWKTEVSPGAGQYPMQRNERTYGPERYPWEAKVCQEVTTIQELGTGPALVKQKQFRYDRDFPGNYVSYRFGSLSDTYEFDFGSYSRPASCPSTMPSAGYVRRMHTDYKQASGDGAYVTIPNYLPGLPVGVQVYDGAGALKSRVTYAYDETGAVSTNYSSISNAAYCSVSASVRGNVTSITNTDIDTGLDSLETFHYDCVGNVADYTDANANASSAQPKPKTTFGYADSFTTTNRPAAPTFAYRTSIALPNGAAVARSYDFDSGLVSQEKSPNSLTTTFEYIDPLNRLTHVNRQGGGDSSITANTNVAYTDSTPPSVQVLKDQFGSSRLKSATYYDLLGRSLLVQASGTAAGSETIETETVYDGMGRVYRHSNPRKPGVASATDGFTTMTYDALGRVTNVNSPDSSNVTTEYSNVAAGTQTQVTDEAGVWRKLVSDGLGRMKSVTDAKGLTSYTYTVLDGLWTVAQGMQTRTFTYDSLKRLKTADNPETGLIQYSYDRNGNLIKRADMRLTTCYGVWNGITCDGLGYDVMNRPVAINYSDGITPAVRFCYDGKSFSGSACAGAAGANGQWMRKSWSGTVNGTGGLNSTSYGFDVAGRLISSVQTTQGMVSPFTFNYSYYNDDQLASVQYPTSKTVVTCYDGNGRVLWASAARSKTDCTNGVGSGVLYASVQSYAPPGAVTQLTLGNGLVETASYNSRLQPLQITAGSLLTLQYDYTAQQPGCTFVSRPGAPNNGNVQSQRIMRGGSVLTQSYCYEDGVNRLTKAYETGTGVAGWTEVYGFDDYGNRSVASPRAGLPALSLETPTAASWYAAGNNRISGWGYDGSGNITQVGGMTRSFTYDAGNRQLTATINGTVQSYEYDGNGQRVAKTANGLRTVYVYDGMGQLAAEYGGPGSTGGTDYLTADALGSTRLVTDGSMAVKRSYDYLPFGEDLRAGLDGRDGTFPPATVATPDVATGIREGFTGKERDGETGLDWFDTRYFSAAQGRYTSPDGMIAKKEWLADPQRWNHYAYVRNNPLRYIDPNGEDLVVYTFYGGDLSEEQKKYLQANMKQIQEAVANKFKQAGVDKVEFRDGTKLTAKQVAEIESKTPTGVAKLNFVSESFRGTNIGGFGGTDAHATSAVALKSIFEGSFLNGLATDDFTRNFRLGEVASHELGHAVGFDSNAYINYLSAGAADYFRSNLMDEHQGVPTRAKSFDTGSDRNKRIIQEINRIGDNTPKR